ncbi:hypothetical protein [Mailhella massiliensis]|uniref:Uncharacterized protein n=1 Tax=Mailhella massiliensis TaxID=1903261 RepID=A0A921DQR0_9BACT|nr:hypothetical protein [Mailhella massiliensis]HJD96785.1 hypothetical protein [Mailhella massiliensis]
MILPAGPLARALARRALPVMEERAALYGASAFLDFGPFPLPRRCLPVLPGPEAKRGVSPAVRPPREKLCAVSCFCLTLLAPEECGELIRRMALHAGRTLLLDFKEPERNLEYPAFFLLAPLRRALGGSGDAKHAGLEAFLYEEGLRPLSRRTLFGGSLRLVELSSGPLP